MIQLQSHEVVAIKRMRLLRKLADDYETASRLRDGAVNINDNQRWSRVATQIEKDISCVSALNWRP